MTALTAHVVIMVSAIAALTVCQITGHNDQTISTILGTLIGAGGWGAIQRQKEPV